jgi:hypothetical protein
MLVFNLTEKEQEPLAESCENCNKMSVSKTS